MTVLYVIVIDSCIAVYEKSGHRLSVSELPASCQCAQ